MVMVNGRLLMIGGWADGTQGKKLTTTEQYALLLRQLVEMLVGTTQDVRNSIKRNIPAQHVDKILEIYKWANENGCHGPHHDDNKELHKQARDYRAYVVKNFDVKWDE